MGSSVQDFEGDDKIARLTSSSVHAFSSVSSAVVDHGRKGAGGGQFSVSLRIVSTSRSSSSNVNATWRYATNCRYDARLNVAKPFAN